MSFPSVVVDAATTVVATVEIVQLEGVAVTTLQAADPVTVPEGHMLGTLAFRLKAQDSSGNPISHFSKAVTLKVAVPAEDRRRAGDDMNRVLLRRYDAATRQWIELPTRPVTATALTADTVEPGLFGVLVDLPIPTVTAPARDSVAADFAPDLRWSAPLGVNWYHLQVLPFNLDGPGVDLLIGEPELVSAGRYQVAAPKFGDGNYVLLPGMTYVWRVRTSPSAAQVGVSDPVWSRWSTGSFRTPAPASETIRLLNPTEGSTVSSLQPTFTWNNSDDKVFYYEVQVSRDPAFDTNSATAKAMVYWELVHGALTSPQNSYLVPSRFLLEPGTVYYWRVRPRVQGDGTPVPWRLPGTFKTR